MYVLSVSRTPFTKVYSKKFRDPVKAMQRADRFFSMHSVKSPLTTYSIRLYKLVPHFKGSKSVQWVYCFSLLFHSKY